MANRLLKAAFAMLSLVLIMSACKINNESELYGNYIADYEIAKETIRLNKDGSFEQKVVLKSSLKVDVAKGRWTYDVKTGYVTFHNNFMIVLDGFNKLNADYAHPKPGTVVEPADKSLVNIVLGSAEGILYKKID